MPITLFLDSAVVTEPRRETFDHWTSIRPRPHWRQFCSVAAALVCLNGTVFGQTAGLTPGSFTTVATFSVDGAEMPLSNAVATIEPRRGAAGYSWLRIHFYSFPLEADDIAGAAAGSVASMDRKLNKLAGNPAAYNKGGAVIQLTVDKDFKVGQVDMSIPGHTCTVAPFEQEVKAFLQDYRFDGRTLRLKSKGSYVCDMKFMNLPNKTFVWNIDLTAPVFAKVAPAK